MKRLDTSNPMEIAVAMMDMGYLPMPETAEDEMESREAPTKQGSKKRLSHKAHISKKRKLSIRKDRERRKNDVLYTGRREYWKCENMGWPNATPIKERKFATRTQFFIRETEPVELE